MDSLIYKNEQTLFNVLFAIATIFWLAITAGTFGIILVYVLLAFIIYLFAQSAFISYIRGTAVKVNKDQFPELYAMYQECCAKLDVKEEPELYILSAGGLLNALATKFMGRKYVVLYSNIVDALEENPEAVKFYIGHELGHIRRNHLRWSPYLFPASILPLIGAAHARAQEYTCDLHGYKCCENSPKDALNAIAVLAAGEKRWRSVNIDQYIAQSTWTGGFWMSLHELIGDYPWLSKRMTQIHALTRKAPANTPRRHFFAWVLALFVPRVGVRGGGPLVSLMVVVAIIGILAAIALPAYQDYMGRAKAASAFATGDNLENSISEYITTNGTLPDALDSVGYVAGSDSAIDSIDYDSSSGSFTIYLPGGNTIIYAPSMEGEAVQWDCTGGTLEQKLRPQACRSK
jgi:Zn-dependent protease with chaperone function/type II secretory pathway pseudopilin PulG